MNYRRLLICFGLTVFTISPTLLTACADDDDDNTTNDDDDITNDDDDITSNTDDDDDLPACETIKAQAECEAREECFAFIEDAWWYLDATTQQCARGQEPVYVDCRTRGAVPAIIWCYAFELADGATAVSDQKISSHLYPRCGFDTNDPVCDCCKGGEG